MWRVVVAFVAGFLSFPLAVIVAAELIDYFLWRP